MIVECALYRNGEKVALDCPRDDVAAVRAAGTESGDFTWVGLYEPPSEELEKVAEVFKLHPLAVEDALSAHQRPKLEQFGDVLLLCLKTLWYVDAADAVETGEVSVFVGPDFVLSVRHGQGAELQSARHALEDQAKVLAHGPFSVLYAVVDRIVDEYNQVATGLEEDVTEVEASVFSDQRRDDTNRIYVLKRELQEMRRAVYPLREPLRRLATSSVPGMSERSAPFFRDVADNLNLVADTVEGLESLLSSAFDAHLARISVQQNEDMRKISAGAALVVVPTLIAGIYGMNFTHMPELEWAFGYPMALGLMLASALGLIVLFKRSGWL
ncbi:magnesium/cobalt transporter CorA [Naumannella halotolerans]|uniref:magnesium/cobalt transporter CorA n=1 Tax=Naumannella halotolerans TaxID=993414 RepID=UPI00370D5B0C